MRFITENESGKYNLHNAYNWKVFFNTNYYVENDDFVIIQIFSEYVCVMNYNNNNNNNNKSAI